MSTSPVMLQRRGLVELALGGLAVGALASTPFAARAQGVDVASLKIATIGAGNEGGALGALFAKAGHKVMYSSRNPGALKDLVASVGPNASAGTVADAVAFGDVILLVVPYSAMEQIAKEYGKALAAKPLVIDVSNPVPRRDGEAFVKQIQDQGGPGVFAQALLPGVRLVRAFNAIHYSDLAKAAAQPGSVGVPIAGNDPQAVALATALIRQTGIEPVLVGGLAKGKYLVPGTPLGGEHSPAELKQIADGLP